MSEAQNESNARPQVMWTVGVFDRTAENPLPLSNRHVYLDWSAVPDSELSRLEALVESLDDDGDGAPLALDETRITVGHRHRQSAAPFYQYRQYFVERSDEEVAAETSHPCRFLCVPSDPDYCETESGEPISRYEVIAQVTGRPDPILLGDPQSILRLDAAPLKSPDAWTVDVANLFAHYLQVVQMIGVSRWFRTPSQITYTVDKDGNKTLDAASFADFESTLAVLALVRQLYEDRLHHEACLAYVEHCGDPTMAAWMQERHDAFEQMLDSTPSPWHLQSVTVRSLVKMVLYGANIMHKKSKYNDEQKLIDLIGAHGRTEVVMAFHSCVMSMLRISQIAAQVIQRDLNHWIQEHGATPPNRILIPDLFDCRQ